MIIIHLPRFLDHDMIILMRMPANTEYAANAVFRVYMMILLKYAARQADTSPLNITITQHFAALFEYNALNIHFYTCDLLP